MYTQWITQCSIPIPNAQMPMPNTQTFNPQMPKCPMANTQCPVANYSNVTDIHIRDTRCVVLEHTSEYSHFNSVHVRE